MALQTQPHGEDPTAGTRGLPVSFSQDARPPGEDGLVRAVGPGELENAAAYQAENPDGVAREADGEEIDFLALVAQAEQQAQLYTQQVNRRAWSQSLRAFHQEHYVGSKYTRPEWRGRSRLFVPKTRTAVRKDMAAVAASLFNSIDAVNCLPGDESDAQQRAGAAIMDELVNYRTDRASGKASFPWFLVAIGARQDADITGICLTKQYWKQEFRKTGSENYTHDDGSERARDHYVLDVDRPDMVLFAPENFVIDPAADWTNPAQSAAYVMLKYPMQMEEIRAKQDAPVNPWKDLTEAEIRGAANAGKQDMEAIRRAREGGLDRFDETQTGSKFQIIWVYEVFMRIGGEDWNFWSVGSQHYLTDPKPVRESYPEQDGERPLALGYGALEAHRIYPMSMTESLQPLQVETNDLRNLTLDATKQNVMPISKVRRGRRIDLDQVKRRSSGSSIFVDDPTDVTWETPPQVGQASTQMGQMLNLEFDDLAGQQNYSNVENAQAVGKTLGGLKLAAGAANSVQEFDIRVWIETWCAPALTQIVRLEQYYESDPVVLGLCGQRAQLFQKHGINKITDDLLEQQITVRVSVGLGAGDPQQRLAKFASAAQVVEPIIQQSPEFQNGTMEINIEAIIEEVFGAVGYKDGGSRFFKHNQQPRQNPMQGLQQQELQAKIAKDDRVGKGALFTGLASLARVALGKKELEADVVDNLLGHQQQAKEMGATHAHQRNQTQLAAMDHGHRHGMAINEHHRNLRNDALQAAQDAAQQAGEGAESEGAAPSFSPQGPPSSAAPQAQPSAPSPPSGQDLTQMLQSGQLEFVRDPHTGRISGVRMAQPAAAR
jgi:hypothetical protein